METDSLGDDDLDDADDQNAPLHFDPIAKGRARPKSLRLAVNAKCWDCQGGFADPNPRWRIGNCAVTRCPLYTVRPYQRFQGRPTPPGLLPFSSRQSNLS
jgi:hypothetical protein